MSPVSPVVPAELINSSVETDFSRKTVREPTTIIQRAAEEGVQLYRTAEGRIKAIGEPLALQRWRQVIQENRTAIIEALKAAPHELFIFNPPGDPANDYAALQERVAIMMEGNGWDEATALREVRWDAERERCWQGFLGNAQHVLDAPKAHWEGLLTRFQAEATERYGKQTGADMAGSLRNWIATRGLH